MVESCSRRRPTAWDGREAHRPVGPSAELASVEARGLEEGKLHAEEQIKDAVERTSLTLAALTEELDRVLAAIEAQAVHAALRVGMEVAKRILEREVERDPDVIERSIAAAVAQLPGAGSCPLT